LEHNLPDDPEITNSKYNTAASVVDATMNDVQRGLAWFICISFIMLIFVWVFKPPVMAPESMAQLNQLVSTLQNILLLAIGFFFGSSKSSQNKDDALMKSALDPSSSQKVSTTTTVEPAKTTTVTEQPPGEIKP
jgi:hypothetical protein